MASDTFTQRGIDFTAHSTKVLIIDEEASDLRVLRLTLEGQGFEVFTSATFEAGVQYLETVPSDFVVVSQGTQAFEGRRVLERATQLNRRQPVLVLTRYGYAVLSRSHAIGRDRLPGEAGTPRGFIALCASTHATRAAHGALKRGLKIGATRNLQALSLRPSQSRRAGVWARAVESSRAPPHIRSRQ